MLDLFFWIAITDLIGLIAFPFVFSLLPWLPDRGFTISKILGLLIVFYPVWILGSTLIVPNSSLTIFVVLVAISVVSLVVAWLYQNSMLRFVQDEWRTLLVAEVIFLTVFALWAFIRFYDPAINHTEQPMDFAFLTTSIVSNSFPPQDPWFAGKSVSYYYFGYLIMGGIANITGITPSVAYNLSLAFVPALTAIGAFGISSNLVRLNGGNLKAAVPTGIVAVFLLMGISNFESALEFLRSSGFAADRFWEWLNIKGLDGPLTSDKWYPTEPGWWWWRATRVIDTMENGVSLDYTITEFPFFSFLLGDLHPHVMSIPFLLLFSAFMLNLFLLPEHLNIRWLRRNQSSLLLLSIILGGAGFINLWDFPTLTAFLFITAFAVGYRQKQALRNGLSSGCMLVFSVVPFAIILYLPFFGTFSSSAAGILPVQSIVTRHIHSGIIWGVFLVILVPFLLIAMKHILRGNRHRNREAIFASAFSILPLILWVLFPIVVQALIAIRIPLGSGEIEETISSLLLWDLTRLPQMLIERFLQLLPFLVLLGAVVYLSLRYLRSREWTIGFPLILLILGLLLVVGPELFYVVDLFHNRMNTIFKFYYQAWIFIAVASSYSIYYLTDRFLSGRYAFRVGGYCWIAILAFLFSLVLYYPAAATYTKVGTLNKRATLDGLAYMRQEAKDELMAINWLNVNSNHTDRIIEAVGEDYLADTSIVSASTGIPTLLGWPGHERQWRGTNEIIDKREEDVRLVYQSTSPRVVNMILHRYDVTYVVVGHKEREKYGQPPLERFDSILEPAFTSNTNDKVTIYRFKG